MKNLLKIRPKTLLYLIVTVAMLFTVTWKTTAMNATSSRFCNPLTVPLQDTPRIKTPKADTTNRLKFIASDTTTLADSSVKMITDTFYIKMSKDTLDGPIHLSAKDSIVVLVQEKKILLYGTTTTDYKDIKLKAPLVELDQATSLITAVNSRDSLGEVVETVHFKQGVSEYTSDTMQFNIKTQKGLTKNTYTQQGEFLVIGETIKKTDTNTVFVHRGRFTTCLLDEPHFAFKAEKIKLVTQKVAITGPAHPEFEGVAVPVWLPFGFFPMKQGRKGGLIPPRFATNEATGVGLERLGYYFLINDYWDVQATSNIYSYGGWDLDLKPTYRKRYKYGGSMGISLRRTKLGFKGDPDYSSIRTFGFNWSHSVDTRARPGVSFSANVNVSSTKHNYYNPYNARQSFNNLQTSSISYSKTWKDKPFNLTVNANHSQNNNLGTIDFTLPDAGFTINTIYPFQRKEPEGAQKWYEKVGVGYQGVFQNTLTIRENDFKLSELLNILQWGARHNFPLTMALPPILKGAVVVSPSIGYSQVWISQKIRKKWNTATQQVDTTITKGLYIDHSTQFGLGLNTALFGTFNFKGSNIQAIRHVVRPSISFNYKPDLSSKHYFTDTIRPGIVEQYSEFSGAFFSGYSKGQTGGIGFSLDNSLEMKLRKKDSSDTEAPKIKLIEGFGLSTNYNFLADSLKLAPISIYFRTNLFEKINITANGTLNPYQTDSIGRDIDRFAWETGTFSPGRLTNATISVGANFQSKAKDEAKDAAQKKSIEENLDDPELRADQQRLLEYARQNPNEFVDFNIPWRFGINYSLGFYQVRKADYSGFETKTNSSININGGFNLTPKWNFSISSSYDFTTSALQSLQLSVSRDMHCWQMSIGVTPIGIWRSFNFTISPKSSILQDLKINRTRTFTSF